MLGLLNSPSHSCPWHMLTITQLLPRCWGLEPVLGQSNQGQPFWPLGQGWTSPSCLTGAVGIHITLCLWARPASPALGAEFGIPLASPHLLLRAPAQPAHEGQLRECHGSLCCWSLALGPWCQGTAISGRQGRAVQPEHPWPARCCLPLCRDAAGSVCLGSDGLFPACERLELGRSQWVYK